MGAPSSAHQQVIAKWTRWLDEIRVHVLNLHHHRELWSRIRHAIETEAADTPDVFLAHYTQLYVDGQVMAVRRVVDPTDKQSVSLGRLLADIVNQHTVLTRERYVAMHEDGDDREWARKDRKRRAVEVFNEYWGDGTDALDPAKVAADLEELKVLSREVRSFATKTVAHIDRRGVNALPTFDNLDTAIEVVADTFKRYALLLTASSWVDLVPVIQNDWRATFRRPLFPPS